MIDPSSCGEAPRSSVHVNPGGVGNKRWEQRWMGDDANDNEDGDEQRIEVDVVMEARVISAGEKMVAEVLFSLDGVPGVDRK